MVEHSPRGSRSSSRQARTNQNLNTNPSFLPPVDESDSITNQILEDLQGTSSTNSTGASITRIIPDIHIQPLVATSSAQAELDRLRQTDVSSFDQRQLDAFVARITVLKQVLEVTTSVLPARSSSKRRRRSSSGERTARERDPILDLVKQTAPKLKFKTLQGLRQWINDVEVVFKLLNVYKSNDPRLALWATTGLEGEVSRRCASKSEEMGEKLTWSTISEVVRDYVSDPAIRQASNAVSFYNSSWTPGQTLGSWKNYLETLEEDLNHTLSDESRLWFTFAKLPEAIRNRMIELDEPRTFKSSRSLWDRALRLETIIKQDAPRGRAARVPSGSRRAAEPSDKVAGDGSAAPQQNQTDDAPSHPSRGSGARGRSRGGYNSRGYRPKGNERPERQANDEELVCFSCGKSGHMSRYCPEASSKGNEDDSKKGSA